MRWPGTALWEWSCSSPGTKPTTRDGRRSSRWGALGRSDVEELPDGRYLIVLRGLVKFRVTSEDDSRSYRLAAVEAMAEPLDDRTRGVLSDRRDQLAQMVSSIAPDSPLFPPSLSDEEFVDTLAQVLTLDPVDRQALLEQRGSVARADALVEIMLRRRSVPL